MKNFKPTVKFNNGNPVVLCTMCRVTMCYVSVVTKDEKDKYIVRGKIVGSDGKDYISTPIGEEPPIRCDNCIEKSLKSSLNE